MDYGPFVQFSFVEREVDKPNSKILVCSRKIEVSLIVGIGAAALVDCFPPLIAMQDATLRPCSCKVRALQMCL
jgi:hypothetical protein